MDKPEYRRETVALIRNKLYTTYQFHGIVGKGKNPDLVIRTAIAEIFSWLRDRFRQFREIPPKLLLPENASQITDEMLESFRISDGYIIETIYLKDEKIWAFRLTEPDMGTSSGRAPIPGRLFMTNFALRVTGGNVELGCMTICSQPEDVPEDAEVFRPKVVRNLKDKLGLSDMIDMTYEAGDLADRSVLRKYNSLIKDGERNMPVLTAERKRPIPDESKNPIPDLNLIKTSHDFLGSISKSST